MISVIMIGALTNGAGPSWAIDEVKGLLAVSDDEMVPHLELVLKSEQEGLESGLRGIARATDLAGVHTLQLVGMRISLVWFPVRPRNRWNQSPH